MTRTVPPYLQQIPIFSSRISNFPRNQKLLFFCYRILTFLFVTRKILENVRLLGSCAASRQLKNADLRNIQKTHSEPLTWLLLRSQCFLNGVYYLQKERLTKYNFLSHAFALIFSKEIVFMCEIMCWSWNKRKPLTICFTWDELSDWFLKVSQNFVDAFLNWLLKVS